MSSSRAKAVVEQTIERANPKNQYFMQLQNLRGQKVSYNRPKVEYLEGDLVQEGPDGKATWSASFKLVRAAVGQGYAGAVPREFRGSGTSKTAAKDAAAKKLLDAIGYRWESVQ
ncbi:hypothetical protein FRB99_008839 [Tulasnella sp. 403]|nr:hypothetical protein FRB99_008839 [Tulasnella sp. 403]